MTNFFVGGASFWIEGCYYWWEWIATLKCSRWRGAMTEGIPLLREGVRFFLFEDEIENEEGEDEDFFDAGLGS